MAGESWVDERLALFDALPQSAALTRAGADAWVREIAAERKAGSHEILR